MRRITPNENHPKRTNIMLIARYIHTCARAAVLLALLVLFAVPAQDAQAQWSPKWLNVGEFQHRYLSGGSAPEADEVAWHYPGIHPRSAYGRWKGFWVSARNVTDETGTNWAIRTSHVGPRFTGVGEVFDVSQTLVSRYPQPVVQVDGLDTFAEPVVVDEVDPSLAADRAVEMVVNTSIGVTMEKRAMQWSHPDHDGYHIIEYTFTNTGNVDDDDEIEVADNNLEDVYFTFLDRPTGAGVMAGGWDNNAGGVAWGQYTMNDAVGDGVSDYGVDFRAQISWLGNNKETDGLVLNTLGGPMWQNHERNPIENDTLGRLGSPNFAGVVTIHADTEAHAPEATSPDDRAQPHTMTYLNSDFGDITSGSSHTDEAKMAIERAWIECGSTSAVGGGVIPLINGECESGSPRTWPTHARIVQGQTADTPRDADPDFANQTASPTRGGGAGGWGFMTAYGPYDMAPGEVVRIVVAEGVAGLSKEAAWDIGRAYKLSGWDDDQIHEFDANGNGTIDADEAMTKNEWVMTARDSLFQLFQFATDNYNGGYNAPHPPAPPTLFTVTSGTDRISLNWEGPAPAGGWEIWRAQKHYSGIRTWLTTEGGVSVPDEDRVYQLIAQPGPNDTSYEDTEVARGGSYYYYLQAVDGNGVKSSRYYAQTYQAAFLRRAPGSSLSQVRIVPNPYHLGAAPEVRLDVQDRMAFYGLPAEATIDIYTELGEHVRSLSHTDGSGDEFWDMTTSSRQLVVSGIYIAVITDEDSGERTVQKFIVIR